VSRTPAGARGKGMGRGPPPGLCVPCLRASPPVSALVLSPCPPALPPPHCRTDPCLAEPCNVNGAECSAQKGDPDFVCTCKPGYASVFGGCCPSVRARPTRAAWAAMALPPSVKSAPPLLIPFRWLRRPSRPALPCPRPGTTCSECATGYFIQSGAAGEKNVVCGEGRDRLREGGLGGSPSARQPDGAHRQAWGRGLGALDGRDAHPFTACPPHLCLFPPLSSQPPSATRRPPTAMSTAPPAAPPPTRRPAPAMPTTRGQRARPARPGGLTPPRARASSASSATPSVPLGEPPARLGG
jgi:hypothetical protein